MTKQELLDLINSTLYENIDGDVTATDIKDLFNKVVDFSESASSNIFESNNSWNGFNKFTTAVLDSLLISGVESGTSLELGNLDEENTFLSSKKNLNVISEKYISISSLNDGKIILQTSAQPSLTVFNTGNIAIGNTNVDNGLKLYVDGNVGVKGQFVVVSNTNLSLLVLTETNANIRPTLNLGGSNNAGGLNIKNTNDSVVSSLFSSGENDTIFSSYGNYTHFSSGKITFLGNSVLIGTNIDSGDRLQVSGSTMLRGNLTIQDNNDELIASIGQFGVNIQKDINIGGSGGSRSLAFLSYPNEDVLANLYGIEDSFYFESAGNLHISTGSNKIIEFSIGNNYVGRMSSQGNFILGSTVDQGYKLAVGGSTIFKGEIHVEGTATFVGEMVTDKEFLSLSTITANQFRLNANNTPPASATAPGVRGEIKFSQTHIHYCYNTNQWVRAALTTW